MILKLVLASLLELASIAILGILSLPRRLWGRGGGALSRVGGALAWPFLTATRAGLDAATRGYPRLIRWSIDHVAAVLGIAVVSLFLLWLTATRLDSELLPEVYQGEFTIEVALPVGTPLAETEATLAPVEAAIAAERERAPEIAGYHKLRARGSGARRYIDLHLQFHTGTSLELAHEVAHAVRAAIEAQIPHAEVLIHVEPEQSYLPPEEAAKGPYRAG
jgi:multidrug efflux pump subunit AcrB